MSKQPITQPEDTSLLTLQRSEADVVAAKAAFTDFLVHAEHVIEHKFDKNEPLRAFAASLLNCASGALGYFVLGCCLPCGASIPVGCVAGEAVFDAVLLSQQLACGKKAEEQVSGTVIEEKSTAKKAGCLEGKGYFVRKNIEVAKAVASGHPVKGTDACIAPLGVMAGVGYSMFKKPAEQEVHTVVLGSAAVPVQTMQ